MTVTFCADEIGGRQYDCVWFEGTKQMAGRFPEAALRPFEKLTAANVIRS